MKKFFSALLIVINVSCFAQSSQKWFLSFSLSSTIAGPCSSLKKQIVDQGFNQTSSFSFLGLGVTTQYPVVTKDLSILLKGGKAISDRRSIYFLTGQTAAGTVEGFKNEGYSDLFFLGSSFGQSVTIKYHVYQLSCGYLYSFPKTRAKIGMGPSLFLFNHAITENETRKKAQTSIIPGASFTGRCPLGTERKLFGMEFVFEGNMAPPAKMKSDKQGGFKPKNASMFSGNAGLAFCLRG